VLDETGAIRLDENRAYLESSRLFVWVEKGTADFAVRTRQAVAAVTGTQFGVDCRRPDVTRLTVAEGLLVLSNDNGRVEVGANMQAIVKSDEAPRPAVHVDVLPAVAWAGIDEGALDFAVGVTLTVQPEAQDGHFSGVSPCFLAHIDYPQDAYGELWLYCRVTDTAGAVREEKRELICTRDYRYRVKRIEFAAATPGFYRAAFRVGHGARAAVASVGFTVR
jgi:hypothetical protein